ncbi:hypothetical protein D9M72_596480 [compost metagenome]
MPGSSSCCTRSRGSSLPRDRCLSRASLPPPSASFAILAFRSATRACMASALALKDSERAFSLVSMIGISCYLVCREMVLSVGRWRR